MVIHCKKKWQRLCWLSVVVKRGTTALVPRKIVKVVWESNFGELLGKVDQELRITITFSSTIN